LIVWCASDIISLAHFKGGITVSFRISRQKKRNVKLVVWVCLMVLLFGVYTLGEEFIPCHQQFGCIFIALSLTIGGFFSLLLAADRLGRYKGAPNTAGALPRNNGRR